MPRHIYSQEGFFDEINHYDENGYAGHSEPGLFGEYNHYDRNGNYIGCSVEPVIGDGLEHYSADKGYIGSSTPGILGGYIHHGDGIDGYSADGIFDGMHTFLDDPVSDDDF